MEGLPSRDFNQGLLMVSVLLLVVMHSISTQNVPLHYVIQENNQNLVIANLVTDYQLEQKYSQAQINNMSFGFKENMEFSNLFTVNRGILKLKSPLDRDVVCPQKETCLMVLDVITKAPFFEIILVKVTVEDLNDNTPRFPKSSEDISVSESSRVGTKLTLPAAVDNDSPAYGIQRYELQPASDTFRLDQDSPNAPFLEIIKELDREKTDLYTFELRAIDGGSPIKMSSMVININILDSNDNSPVFVKDNFVVSVNESIPVGSSIIQVEAIDKDSGLNGVVTYSFDSSTDVENGHLFRVDEKTGRVFVKAQLDFEVKKQHVLTVLARDINPDYSGATARVTVNVQDVNDNNPNIKINDYIEGNSLKVPENSPVGEFVAHLTVIDLDSGENGQFECAIDKVNDFKLERLYPTEFKLATVKPFDRETLAEYFVQVTCEDSGQPSLKSSKMIPVVITDVNDMKPKFTTNAFVANVLESAQVGSFIMRLTATDSDEGQNGRVQYYIEEAYQNKFSVDLNSGNVTLKEPLDREKESRLQFDVTAVDRGTPQLSSTATVIIDVIDEDDNLPVFKPQHEKLSIREHSLPRTEVGSVFAIDADSDLFNQFTYDMDADDFFTIDSQSGMIYTTRDIDREEVQNFNLHVYAITSDANPKTSTGMVTITIDDVNDHNPVFIFPTPKNNTIHIPNTLTRGEVVTSIKADDLDLGDNAKLSFTIIGGNSEEYFIIDSNMGAIMVHQNLESIELQSFGLVIRVQDAGLPPKTAEAYLNIIVNRSLTGSQAEMLENKNITIAISIACISGLIMVFLVIAIAIIVRQRKINPKSRMYNYTPKVMDRNAYFNGNGGKSPADDSIQSDIKGFTNFSTESDIGSPQSTSPFANDQKHDGYPESEADSACSADTDSGRGSNEDFSHEQIRHASDSSYQYGCPSGHVVNNNQREFNKPDIVVTSRQSNPLYGVPNRATSQTNWQHANKDISTQNLQFGTHLYQPHCVSTSSVGELNVNNSNLNKTTSSEQMYRDKRRDLLYRDNSPAKNTLAAAKTGHNISENKYIQLSNATSGKTTLHEVHV